MENEKYFCPRCGAENKSGARFCRSCGVELNSVCSCPKCNAINAAGSAVCRVCGSPLTVDNSQYAPAQPPVNAAPNAVGQPDNRQYIPIQQYAPYNNGGNFNNNPYGFNPSSVTEIDGVPMAEITAFVGPNSGNIVEKFRKKAEKNSKVGFNHAVFWPGLFFGPFASAFWFLHRRMNKIGSILLAVGAVLLALEIALTGLMLDQYSKIFNIMDENGFFSSEYDEDTGSYSFGDSFDDFSPAQQQQLETVSLSVLAIFLGLSFISLLRIVAAVLLALFADKMYMSFCTQKIKALKQIKPDAGMDEISAAGGVRNAAWVCAMIGGIVVCIAAYVIVLVPVITNMVNIVLSNINEFQH